MDPEFRAGANQPKNLFPSAISGIRSSIKDMISQQYSVLTRHSSWNFGDLDWLSKSASDDGELIQPSDWFSQQARNSPASNLISRFQTKWRIRTGQGRLVLVESGKWKMIKSIDLPSRINKSTTYTFTHQGAKHRFHTNNHTYITIILAFLQCHLLQAHITGFQRPLLQC